jgi:membrane-bound lytic murein transglycosylase B
MSFARVVFACALFLALPLFASAALTPEERAELERQLAEVEQQIAANKTELIKKQGERQSLERDVAVIDGQVKSAQLAIKQRDLAIRKLTDGITDKEAAIKVLDQKVIDGQESVAQMIRRTHEIDEISIAELALGGSITDIFTEVDNYQIVQEALDAAFKQMAAARADLGARKEALLEQQSEEEELKQLQVLQQKSLKQSEEEKKVLVSYAKGQESQYQRMINEQTKTANEIRAALFNLRDSGAIPFGKAYEYAKEAAAATGVRPALILGVLAQETNLGENVGTGNWKDDMHPTRDVPVFKTLMEELGLDPDTQKVSKKPWYGWGGAMGPAQFIPSTWVRYKDRIGKLSGTNPPNPWDARTAIFASGLLMSDNGADTQTRAAERLAALRYFAGWGNANKPAYAFYGDDVMALADKFQREIDVLEGR